MAYKAPGKHYREGVSLIKLLRMFPNDQAAEKWFESRIWPDGPYCSHCGSFNVQEGIKHKSMTHRCRDCADRPMFSLKTGNVMQGTKLGYQTWAIAIYLVTTSLKGASSMKLHRDLEITQKSAWHLAMRLRKAHEAGKPLFKGPVEADETYMGGKEGNKHADKKLKAGRGPVGKTAVAGTKDRETNKIVAKVVENADARTLQGFVTEHTDEGTQVYTDEASVYTGIGRPHEAVKHSVGEYVREQAHTNGMESFWSMLKRGHDGVYHKMSPKHLDRYVTEFAERHNNRPNDTGDQMGDVAAGMVGKRLRYKDLIADNGLSSGARVR